MQLRTVLVGMLALVFSVSAALAVYLFTRQPLAGSETKMVSVVVAAAPIARGVTLSKEMLRTREYPVDYVREGAVHSIDEAVGRTVWIPLIANDDVLESKLSAKGAGRGMASLIPPGMRAVTIQTPNVATGVAGFILPGSKVDVLWTVSKVAQDDETGGGSTATVLQNIEILAVDQQLEMPNENKVDAGEMRSVTLLVSPSDAAALDLAQNRGTLRLSLRNPEDTATDPIAMATLAAMQNPAGALAALAATAGSALSNAQMSLPIASEIDAHDDAEAAAEPKRVEIALPIRTLRGTSSGGVLLRVPSRGDVRPADSARAKMAVRS